MAGRKALINAPSSHENDHPNRGLVQKAKILEAFNINVGDDLQHFESLNKAARLLGFLSHSLEQLDGCEASMFEHEEMENGC
jgi:hypothetical protein